MSENLNVVAGIETSEAFETSETQAQVEINEVPAVETKTEEQELTDAELEALTAPAVSVTTPQMDDLPPAVETNETHEVRVEVDGTAPAVLVTEQGPAPEIKQNEPKVETPVTPVVVDPIEALKAELAKRGLSLEQLTNLLQGTPQQPAAPVTSEAPKKGTPRVAVPGLKAEKVTGFEGQKLNSQQMEEFAIRVMAGQAPMQSSQVRHLIEQLTGCQPITHITALLTRKAGGLNSKIVADTSDSRKTLFSLRQQG